jgi:hypothetical protein
MVIIALGSRPYSRVIIGSADFSAPASSGSIVTLGDLTVIAATVFIGMYLHELLYWSSEVHYVAVIHHVGAVIVAAVTLSLNVRWKVEQSTTAYMLLIMTYGTSLP